MFTVSFRVESGPVRGYLKINKHISKLIELWQKEAKKLQWE